MNLMNKCTSKEIKLMEQADVKIENRDYTIDELKKVERDITEFIMNHSTKNGSISKLQNEYQSVYRTLNVKEK